METLPHADRVVVLDTETTGLSGSSRIVEFAAIEVEPRTGRIGATLHRLVDPGVPIPAAVTRIHGIRDRDVRGRAPFAAIAGEVRAFLRGAIVAIQNASFDCRMLDAEFERAHLPSLDSLCVRVVDTVAVSRAIFPLAEGHNLDAICDRAGVDRRRRTLHGALVDVQLLARALPRLASEYDALCAREDSGCARGLGKLARHIAALCSEVTSGLDIQRAESADRYFALVAAADVWIGRYESVLEARLRAEVPPEGWCCSHHVARWRPAQSVAWKEAALAHIAHTDFASFQSEVRTRVLTPSAIVHGEAQLPLRALEAVLGDHAETSSISDLAGALALLREARAQLQTIRHDLRAALLQFADAGYALRQTQLDDRLCVRTDYRAAVKALAADADLAPFATRAHALSVRRRDLARCEALFGPPRHSGTSGRARVA